MLIAFKFYYWHFLPFFFKAFAVEVCFPPEQNDLWRGLLFWFLSFLIALLLESAFILFFLGGADLSFSNLTAFLTCLLFHSPLELSESALSLNICIPFSLNVISFIISFLVSFALSLTAL